MAACRQTWRWRAAESSTPGLAGSKKEKRHWAWLRFLKPQSLLPGTHHSNEDTPPNSAPPYEPMEAVFIQTTTTQKPEPSIEASRLTGPSLKYQPQGPCLRDHLRKGLSQPTDALV